MSDQNFQNFDPTQPQEPESPPEKKDNPPWFTAFSIMGVIIIVGLAAYIYYLLFFGPARSLVFGDPQTQISIQETALQAAAEATAAAIYLQPGLGEGNVTKEPEAAAIQPSQTPAESLTEQAAQPEPPGEAVTGQDGDARDSGSLISQVLLLGLLGLTAMLLLGFFIVRRLRSPKN